MTDVLQHWTRRAQLGEERERVAIRRDFSASLMSDTKWRKAIEALSLPHLHVPFCIVKFVGAPNEKLMRTPNIRDVRTASAMDSELGPFLFRSIEWLEVPRSRLKQRYEGDPGVEELQDADAAMRAIEALGEYPTEQTARGFRIVGHVARS